MVPGLGTDTSAGFITVTILTQNPALLSSQRLESLYTGPPLLWKMKPTCSLEFEMSHHYLSTLNIKVCCCFIELDSAIKMKKAASYLPHWSMVNVVNMCFSMSLLQINTFRLQILIRIIRIYRKSSQCQIPYLAFRILGLTKSLHPFFRIAVSFILQMRKLPSRMLSNRPRSGY